MSMNEQQNRNIEVSAETLVRMRGELEELTSTGRDKMAARIQAARIMGDLKENAEYHSAKDDQGLMEARIRQLEHLVKNAVVREASGAPEVIDTGMIVKVKDGDDTDEYLVASTNEEKIPGLRTVTVSSPMGSALRGKRVGDVVDVEAPAGTFSIEVLDLRNA